MGNSVKYNKVGSIYFDLDKLSYHSDETIKGVIHFTLNEVMPACILELQFKGKEFATWQKQSGNTRVKFTGKKTTTKTRYPLKCWNSPLDIGDYCVPFTFELPPNLPSSFRYKYCCTKAYITYRLTCNLIGESMGLKYNQDIHYFQDSSRIAFEENIQKTMNLRTCCCFSRGNLTANITWPQSQFGSSQTSFCSLELDNTNGKLAVNSILYKILYNVRQESDWGFHNDFSVPIFEKKIEVSLKAGEARIGENSIKLELDFKEVNEDVLSIHTTTGQLVQCRFFVQVRPQMEGNCMACCNQPKYNSYFVFNPDCDVASQDLVNPEEWKPEIFENVSVAYNRSFEVHDEEEKNDEKARSKKCIKKKYSRSVKNSLASDTLVD